jgi:hypothetical protein
MSRRMARYRLYERVLLEPKLKRPQGKGGALKKKEKQMRRMMYVPIFFWSPELQNSSHFFPKIFCMAELAINPVQVFRA